ncbi:MAG: nucleoside hydrolase [Solirubrobacterales bacterium]
MPQPVIVDCDPGIDDATALAMIVASDELELKAVTTVSGNVPVELSTRNAARVLSLLGREDVPIAAGASRPLVRANPYHPDIHGPNGLGGVELVPTAAEHGAEPAIELLAAMLAAADPGSITLIAIGPLTNVALLLALYPELADRISSLRVMGASPDRGNVTPYAEFNIWMDPEAAHRVLVESTVPRQLITLGATRRATVAEDHRAALAVSSTAGAALAEMILGYADLDPASGWPLHDAMVVAELLEPGTVELRPGVLEVDTGTGQRRGETTFDFEPQSPTGLEVGVGADTTRFRELLAARIARL